MYNYTLDSLNKRKEEIENMIKAYQQPINNIINTGNQSQDLYELKILNDGDEVENIFISSNTIFIGSNRMQIKKTDGTIEKYNIEKYYPIDEKDERIKELNKKVEELERRLNNGYKEPSFTNKELNKSTRNDDVSIDTKSKTTSKSIQE